MTKRKKKIPAKAEPTPKPKGIQTPSFFLLLNQYHWVFTIFTFALIYVLFFIKVDAYLLFTDTVLTGGDSASWLQPMLHLKEVLIPSGRLFGWTQSNFYGYSEGQFYFPLPFLTGVLFSTVLPDTIALKLATVLGLLSLPVASFFTVKKLSKNHWAALSGALFSLVFIFNESYTMFGGNFLSTMAGEFAYSYAVALFVLFIGVIYDTFMENKSPLAAGILLGLIGLSHAFIFMVAFFVPAFFLFVKWFVGLNFKKSEDSGFGKFINSGDEMRPEMKTTRFFEKTVWIYVVGLLLMSFWFLPMALNFEYAQSIAMTWHFPTFGDFFKQTFFGLITAGIIITISVTFFSKRLKIAGAFFLYLLLTSLFYFNVSALLEVPDIRFIPPMLITAMLALSISLEQVSVMSLERVGGEDAEWEKEQRVLPSLIMYFIAAFAASLFVLLHPVNVETWFSWNYTGYEAKDQYPTLVEMVDEYSGDINDGRILWEKQLQNDNVDFGSERGFENIMYFFGRPSAEGIHYGSTFMARPTTYMQSEFSLNPVCPEAQRIYSSVNPGAFATRFYQANAELVITYSDAIHSYFEEHPDFTLDDEYDKFSVFRFNLFPDSYIRVVEPEDLFIINDESAGWKAQFRRYYRDYELYETPFLPLSFANDLTNDLTVFDKYDDFLETFYDENYDFSNFYTNYAYADAISDEDIGELSMRFTTSEVGKPHILKISYAPNWKSKNGEKIYPVSPGFIMIIPTTSEVEIYYGWTKIEILGMILTLLLIPLILLRKKLFAIELKRADLFSKIVKIVFLSIAVLVLILSFIGPKKLENDTARIVEAYYAGDYEKALFIADRYANEEHLNEVDDSRIFTFYDTKAKILYSIGRYAEAMECYDVLEKRYRHSRLYEGTLSTRLEIEAKMATEDFIRTNE